MKFTTLMCAILFVVIGTGIEATVKIDSYTFGAMEARSIGPATMSGRIMSIDAINKEPRIFYVGTASGGLWKTINGGLTFKRYLINTHNRSELSRSINRNQILCGLELGKQTLETVFRLELEFTKAQTQANPGN